jgi:HlyD family secretion protein
MNAPAPAVLLASPSKPPPAHEATDLKDLLDEPAQRTWYRRPWVWAVLGGLLLAALGFWWWSYSRAAGAQPSYATQVVARGNLTLTVTANGTLQPTRSISIGSELSGTVRQVNVDVNDRIKKGQVLVVLDTAKLQDQIVRSRAAVTSATAVVAQSVATLGESRASLARFVEVERISGGEVPSKAEMDAARAALARAVGAEASARASVSDALAALSTDQTNLRKASIVAPADGLVLTRAVDPGNVVAASLQAVTLFSVAEDLAKLRLWVYVDEADVGSVKVGQTARFTVSAYPTRSFPAQITRVGFGSTITDNVVTYLTYLDVDNADGALRPGMTATASITANQRNDVLLVPNTALRFTPTTAGAAGSPAKGGVLSSLTPRMPGGNTRKSAASDASTAGAKQVWILGVEANAVPQAVAVTPGISDGRMTEVTGGDLREGMRVITDQKALSPK